MSKSDKWGQHPNTLAAYYAGRLEGVFSRREAEIMAAFRELKEATDREVMEYLGLPDMNCVRPRINELRDAGLLVETAQRTCPITQKTVRACRIPAAREEQAPLPLEGAA